ncbi:MAG: CPBP family intramembrane glutamic endopeptidase [Gammaproteobacteria bacterium]
MKQFLQALSGRAEFLIVVLGSIGVYLLSNFAVLLDPQIANEAQPLGNETLVGMLIYEGFVLLWLGTFMKLRGWTRERLGFAPALRDTAIGILLALAIFGLRWIIDVIVGSVAPGFLEAAEKLETVSGVLDMRAVVLVSLIDPLFEELFMCAYVISALKEKRGPAFALNVSVGLRVACHLNEGAYGVLTIGPLALLFGYWYLRSGRIWPLLVAHAVLDFVGLVALGSVDS